MDVFGRTLQFGEWCNRLAAGIGIGVIDFNGFSPSNNRIEGNTARGNRVDLLFRVGDNSSADGNCFTGNSFSVSSPERIESVMPCGKPAGALPRVPADGPPPPPDVDYRILPAPPPQVTMPAAGMTRPAGTAPFTAPDLTAVSLP